MPATSPMMERWCLPYFSALGSNSSNEIKIMIPATAERINASSTGFQKGSKKKNAIKAPNGSASPDEKRARKLSFCSP